MRVRDSARKTLGYAVAMVIAAVAAASVKGLDAGQTQAAVSQHNLLFARQIASQALGLAFVAKDHGERDPLGWAVGNLGQGEEPRIMRLSVFQSEAGNPPEQFSLNSKTGLFDYSRVLIPEDGSGVRIKISTGFHGFWGTKTRARSDCLLALFGFLIFLITLVTIRRFAGKDETPVVPGPKILIELGKSIRETLRHTKVIFDTVNTIELAVSLVQNSADAQLEELNRVRMTLLQIEQSACRVRASAMTAVIEAARFGVQAGSLKQAAEEMHEIAQEIRNQNLSVAASLSLIEARIQPVAALSDKTRSASEQIARAEMGMSEQAGAATRLLKTQIQALKNPDGGFSDDIRMTG